MNVVTRPGMSVEEFLAWEAGQELKWEFDGTRPVEVVGGTRAHALIQSNVIAALRTRLRGTACRVFGSDLKIGVDGRIRYPDAFVTCTDGPRTGTVADAPVVIFEIISTSTGRTDRIAKNREYAATPSVMRYVMLEQDEAAATVFERIGETWVGHVLGAEATLHMPEIGVEVPLAEFYEDLTLD